MSENFTENNPLTWWERTKYIFIRPNKAFKDIEERPKLLFPVLTIIIVLTILALLKVDVKIQALQSQIQGYQGVEGAEDMAGLTTGGVYPILLYEMVIMPLLYLTIKSFMVNGISNVMDGVGTFKDSFGILAYAYFPVLIGQIIITIISMASGVYEITLSPAMLLPAGLKGGFIYHLFYHFDVFIIWYQILAVIGIAYGQRISKKRASIGILATWIPFILISAGIKTIISAFQM